MFGFKKKTVEDILSEIEKLTDEEKSRLIGALNGAPEGSEAGDSLPVEEDSEAVAEETAEEPPAASEENPENPPADIETGADGETGEEGGENASMPQESIEEPPTAESPAEEIVPETESVSESASHSEDNMRELVESQTAKISALESELAALKETIDNIVANQDNQNFGLSPTADFGGDESFERRDAVLRGYAGRRANEYK